jgi:hypothetical protein
MRAPETGSNHRRLNRAAGTVPYIVWLREDTDSRKRGQPGLNLMELHRGLGRRR